MKTREEIMADIVKILHEQYGMENLEIRGNDYLYEDLCLDSLEMVDLVARLKETCDLGITGDDIDEWYDITVDDLISIAQKFSN